MSIYKGSRYEKVPVYTQYNENYPSRPSNIPTLRRRDLTKFYSNEAITHVFQRGDRIDLLAHRYYSDAQLWWVIMDANPRYMTPWEITIGSQLVIPPLTSFMGGEI
jgi:hypothetical protein